MKSGLIALLLVLIPTVATADLSGGFGAYNQYNVRGKNISNSHTVFQGDAEAKAGDENLSMWFKSFTSFDGPDFRFTEFDLNPGLTIGTQTWSISLDYNLILLPPNKEQRSDPTHKDLTQEVSLVFNAKDFKYKGTGFKFQFTRDMDSFPAWFVVMEITTLVSDRVSQTYKLANGHYWGGQSIGWTAYQLNLPVKTNWGKVEFSVAYQYALDKDTFDSMALGSVKVSF